MDADTFLCTWGTFATICFTIYNLPPGSQAAIRDVAEAYRTIPVIPEQWPGLVVRLLGDDEFAINTCNNFGLASAGGIYGEIGDATLDIFCAQGIGPIFRWVDDHILFRIQGKPFLGLLPFNMHRHLSGEHCTAYNVSHLQWHSTIMQNGGRSQSGSCFWYMGQDMPDDLPAEFDKDAACPITDISQLPNRSPHDSLFTYCDVDIDAISEQLGIPWEPSKTMPFSSIVPYLGFEWNLSELTVAITEDKKTKYRTAIRDWLPNLTHNLEETQKLYESFYTPVSCSRPAVLTSPAWNASWVPSAVTPLFPITLHITLMPTFPGGSMHSVLQGSPVPSQVQLLSSTNEPSLTPAQVLASALLLLATSGVPGASSQAGKPMEGISDGQKRLALSFLRSLSAQPVSLASSSESLATTAGSSRAGGKEGAETGKLTRCSDAYTASNVLTNALLSHAMSPAAKTQQTVPQEDSTHHLLTSSQLSVSRSLSSGSSLISTNKSPLVGSSADPEKASAAGILDRSRVTNRVRHGGTALDTPPLVVSAVIPRIARPSAYGPSLSPLPSPLRPHCLAKDRLQFWKPSPDVCSHHSSAQEDDVQYRYPRLPCLL